MYQENQLTKFFKVGDLDVSLQANCKVDVYFNNQVLLTQTATPPPTALELGNKLQNIQSAIDKAEKQRDILNEQYKNNTNEIYEKLQLIKIQTQELNHIKLQTQQKINNVKSNLNLATSEPIKVSAFLDKALAHHDNEVFNFLINKPFSTDYRNVNGDSLLHLSIKHKSQPLFNKVLEKDQAMLINNDGKTPYMIACELKDQDPSYSYYVQRLEPFAYYEHPILGDNHNNDG